LLKKRLHEVERALWFRFKLRTEIAYNAPIWHWGYIAGHSFLLWGKCPHEFFNKFLACIIREAAEEWFWGGAIAATMLRGSMMLVAWPGW